MYFKNKNENKKKTPRIPYLCDKAVQNLHTDEGKTPDDGNVRRSTFWNKPSDAQLKQRGDGVFALGLPG